MEDQFRNRIFDEIIKGVVRSLESKPKEPTTSHQDRQIERIDKALDRLDQIAATAPESQIGGTSEEKTMVTTTEEPETVTVKPQIEKGEACDICSLDHFSVCAKALAEGKRFIKDGKIDDKYLTKAREICRGELNLMERDDASPAKVMALPPMERKIMNKFTPRSKELRHSLNDIISVDSLIEVGAKAEKISESWENEIFQYQLKRELAKNEIRKERPEISPEEEKELVDEIMAKLAEKEE